MKTTKTDAAQEAVPQKNWHYAETGESIYAAAGSDDPDEEADEEEEENDDEEEQSGDWGHIDPAEGNSPFPDPNAPTSPGSAV